VEYLQHRRKDPTDGDAAGETGNPSAILLEISPKGSVEIGAFLERLERPAVFLKG